MSRQHTLNAIGVLEREHVTIDSIVDMIEAVAARLESGHEIGGAMIADLLDFCEHFADGCHVAKEELGLFPALEAHDLTPDTCLLGALRAQHEAAQAYVREMRASAARLRGRNRGAQIALATSARDYVALMREHVRIERGYFYAAAHGKLSDDEEARLLARFEEIDQTLGSPAVRRRYLELPARYRPVVTGWR